MEVVNIFVLSLVFISCLVYLLGNRRRSRRPPGPPGLPFIGNLLQIDMAATHIYLWKLAKKYGPIMFLKFGSIPVLIISSPKLAKEVLKTHDLVFCSRPKLQAQLRLTYNGSDIAFAPYGQSWRELRKISVLHIFNNKRVQSFRNIREKYVFHMVKNISNSAERGEIVNLNDIATSLTSSLIFKIAFGTTFEDTGLDRRKFDQLMIENQVVIGGFFVADLIPSFSWLDMISGKRARLERVFNELDGFFQGLIDSHLESRTKKSNDEDILHLLIHLKEDDNHLTWNHIKGILMDLLVGGTDTAMVTIVWAMTTLMQNPVIMKRLQQEIRDTIKEQGSVTEDDISKLKYLKLVIKEILRLYPPAPLLVVREALEDCNIEGYEIKSKTLVYVNAWAVARDPESWESPNEFIPERFLNSEVDVLGQHFQLIPFGAGRRICPGITMGIATVELVLANLLYAFNWELPPGMKKEDIDTEGTLGLALLKKNPLCLLPQKYN